MKALRKLRYLFIFFGVIGSVSPTTASIVRYDIEGSVIGEFGGGIYSAGGPSAGDSVSASFVLDLSNPRLDEGGSGYTRYDTSAQGWVTLNGDTESFATDDLNWRHYTLDISPVRGESSFFSRLYLTAPYFLDGRSLSFYGTTYQEQGEQFSLRVFQDFQTFDFGRSIGTHVMLRASVSTLTVLELPPAAAPAPSTALLLALALPIAAGFRRSRSTSYRYSKSA